MVRYAPPPPDPNAPARGGPAAARVAPGALPRPRPRRPAFLRRRHAAGADARGALGPGGRAGVPAGPTGRGRGPVFTPDDWNDIGVIADVNTLRKLMNGGVAGSRPWT